MRMAGDLYTQLHRDYRKGAAALEINGSYVRYLERHGTLRKRAARAERLGYWFSQIDREDHPDAVYAINTSTPERQGRPMGQGYLDPPVYGPNPMTCEQHHVYPYGVLYGDTLVAYLWLYRSGELAMVSSILGHARYMDDGIMYLLWRGMMSNQWRLGGTVFYNLWNSGTDGLRFFKERVGLTEQDVEWRV